MKILAVRNIASLFIVLFQTLQLERSLSMRVGNVLIENDNVDRQICKSKGPIAALSCLEMRPIQNELINVEV